MVALLILLLAVSLIVSLFTYLRLKRMRDKLSYITELLSEVQDGNGNRKLLAGAQDETAPLIYQLNDIVSAYEEKLLYLKKADETNKQLMTGFSHDVRTPLTTLIGYLDAVHSGIVTGSEREAYVNTARRKAYDLKDYTDILFDWFRLHSDEFALSIETIETAELTRNIFKDWIPVFHENKMEFEIEIPEYPVLINIDPDGYSRIVNNLVQNAVTHSQASKITLTLTADSQNMRLCIADNGIGIAKEELNHIFERLYKCNKGHSEKGSGLGLSIVQQMVRRMNGLITVTSELRQYTAFTVELPLP